MTKQERLASIARMEKARAEVRAVVATGKCPQCGRGLRQNLSLTGWFQCEQFGAENFRLIKDQPPCSWQGFTE